MVDINQLRVIANRILDQTATAQELKIFRRYLSSGNEQEIMNEIFIKSDADQPEMTIHLGVSEKRQMLQHILGRQPMLKQRKPFKLIRMLPKVAAAILIVSIGVYALLKWKGGVTDKSAFKDVYVAYGQQKILWMPDSTRIVLNAGSHLRYNYSEKIRDILLEGEAFFEVTPNPEKPFFVHSNKLVTKVLGTAFNIRAYKGDAVISVQVKKGKVQVSLIDSLTSATNVVALLPAQQVVYSGERLLVQDINITDISAWAENRLIFNEQPIAVILDELDRIYNVRFSTGDKAASALQRRYTIRLNKMSLDQTLETVSALTGLSFQRKDSVIIVK